MPISAVQHIRRMCGGAQAHQFLCDDGHQYVVKFRNNPQHPRILANEFVATRLANKLGLSVPAHEFVEVDEAFARNCPGLTIQLVGNTVRCEPGLCFGSRLVPNSTKSVKTLQADQLTAVTNVNELLGVLAFDKWTGNSDRREMLFWRRRNAGPYTAAFIDQANCFNAGEWNFPDWPLKGTHAFDSVYLQATEWSDFEPWLSRIESFSEDAILDCAQDIPPEWAPWDHDLEVLIGVLLERRKHVRQLISDFRNSERMPFPNWRKAVTVAVNCAKTGVVN